MTHLKPKKKFKSLNLIIWIICKTLGETLDETSFLEEAIDGVNWRGVGKSL